MSIIQIFFVYLFKNCVSTLMVSVVVYINVLCYGVGCLLTSSLQTIHRSQKGEKKMCLWWPFCAPFPKLRWAILSCSLLLDIPKMLYCAMVMFVVIQVDTVLQKQDTNTFPKCYVGRNGKRNQQKLHIQVCGSLKTQRNQGCHD